MKKEYLFSCIGDLEDLNYLYKLFDLNDIECEWQQNELECNKMGLDEILKVLLPNEYISVIFGAIGIWFQNRKKELYIKDVNSGKEIHLVSHNGKAFSDAEMDQLKSFFDNKDVKNE